MSLGEKISSAFNYILLGLLIYYVFIQNNVRERNYTMSVADSNQMTQPGKLLNSTHQITESGWSNTHLKEVNAEMVYSPVFGIQSLNQFRFKKFELYQFMMGTRVVKVAVGDVYIGANMFFLSYDYEKKELEYWNKDFLPVIDKNLRFNLADDVYSCKGTYKAEKEGNYIMVAHNLQREENVCVSIIRFGENGKERGNFVIKRPMEEDQMFKLSPISEDNTYWFYNMKAYNLQCGGELDGQMATDCVATIDQGRGLFYYKTNWVWATGTGKSGDQTISLELGGGIAHKSAKATDDSFKIGKKVFHLNPVKMEYDPLNLMNSFVFKTHPNFEGETANMAEIVFRSEYVHEKRDNLIVLTTSFDYVYGTYSGWVTDNDGNKYEFEGVQGYIEIVKLKW